MLALANDGRGDALHSRAIMSASVANNLAALLQRTARCWPWLPAVAHGTRIVHRYGELTARAARLAGALREAGLRPGDRVALVAHNVPEYIETLFGCWWAGLTAVPVNAKLHPSELSYVLANSGARWAFVDASWHAALGGRRDDTDGS